MGVGRLNIIPLCKTQIGNSILFSTNKVTRDTQLDIIPLNNKYKLLDILEKTVRNVLPENLTNTILFKYLPSRFLRTIVNFKN